MTSQQPQRRRVLWVGLAVPTLLVVLNFFATVPTTKNAAEASRKVQLTTLAFLTATTKRNNNKVNISSRSASSFSAHDEEEEKWQMVVDPQPDYNSTPYDAFAPRLDVIWSRGWYNVELPVPGTTPLSYFNEKGRPDGPTTIGRGRRSPPNLDLLHQYWNASRICSGKHTYLWVRTADLEPFSRYALASYASTNTTDCNITLITSNAIDDVPGESFSKLLQAPFLHQWYTQNLVLPSFYKRLARLRKEQLLARAARPNQTIWDPWNTRHYASLPSDGKLQPIPLGLPLHYGFEGSPHTLHTAQALQRLRQHVLPLEQRVNRSHVLVDLRSTEGRRRRVARMWLRETVQHCNISEMTFLPTHQAWQRYASHAFAAAPTGTGRDTYRLWELIFLGTVPIVHSGDGLDSLLLPAHVPVILVDDWQEVCDLQHNATLYQLMVERYRDWIHPNRTALWFKPSTWIPRNQSGMHAHCRRIPGCVEAFAVDHRMYPRNITEAQQRAGQRQLSQAKRLQPAQKNSKQFVGQDFDHRPAWSQAMHSARTREQFVRRQKWATHSQ